MPSWGFPRLAPRTLKVRIKKLGSTRDTPSLQRKKPMPSMTAHSLNGQRNRMTIPVMRPAPNVGFSTKSFASRSTKRSALATSASTVHVGKPIGNGTSPLNSRISPEFHFDLARSAKPRHGTHRLWRKSQEGVLAGRKPKVIRWFTCPISELFHGLLHTLPMQQVCLC
ncbi:hypothetical protein D3C77_74490 [compost metagenome]